MSPATSTGIGVLLADAVRRDAVERRRSRLTEAALAAAGAFLLAAISVATMPFSKESQPLDPRLPALAPFIEESGLRPGVITGAVLLVLPIAAFAAQSLRVGSAARERRLAALRLAGATRGDLRRIAAVEGARSGLVGSLLVAPAYLLLWLLLGLALPSGARMLPPLLPVQLVAWVALVPLLTVGSVLAAVRAARAAGVDPLGGTRRQVRPLSRTRLWSPVVLLGVGVLGPFAIADRSQTGWVIALWTFLLLPIAAAMTGGASLMVLTGRLLVRRTDVASRIAGGRLLADPRSPGRAAGALLAGGLVTGFSVALLGAVAFEPEVWEADQLWGLGGVLAALLSGCFAILVGAASLLVGASEQVLDRRRSTAVLAALGAGPAFAAAVLRTQLRAAAVAPAATGALTGWALVAMLGRKDVLAPVRMSVPVALLAIALAGGIAALGARLVARGLRGQLAEAASVENLRAP